MSLWLNNKKHFSSVVIQFQIPTGTQPRALCYQNLLRSKSFILVKRNTRRHSINGITRGLIRLVVKALAV